MTRGAKRKTRGPGRRLLEIGKDLLIAALVLVNLTLAIMCLPSKTLTQTKWLAGALRPFAGLFGLNEAELTYTAPATGSTIVGAAQPLIITLSTEAGRQSAQYDFAALDELYGQYGSLLAQALESAETPQTCTRTEFYAALRGTGAAFCFPGAISPSVLGAWLNVRAPEGGQAQWYVLAQEEDGVTLYLAGEQFSAAKTALPAQSLTAQLETAVPDGSFFAFEAGPKHGVVRSGRGHRDAARRQQTVDSDVEGHGGVQGERDAAGAPGVEQVGNRLSSPEHRHARIKRRLVRTAPGAAERRHGAAHRIDDDLGFVHRGGCVVQIDHGLCPIDRKR